MNKLTKTILAAAITAVAFSAYAVEPKTTTSAKSNTTASAKVNVSPEEKNKIEQVVHDYLVTKPEVLIEAMQTLQQRQYQQAQDTVKKTQETAATYVDRLFREPNDPVAGNPKGTITIAEFFDYQCPHCVDMAPVMESIIKSNPNVRVIYKEFPIRGPASELAARAALAANKQGKYYEFSHAVLTSNKPITQESLDEIAKKLNLDVDKLKKDMTDSSVNSQVSANMKLAQDLKLLGTPAFFIGKTDAKATDKINYLPGQANAKQLQDLIDKSK